MSVTIQRETLAFYDYCLCVPPLKPEWRELSARHFWFLRSRGYLPRREGGFCTLTFSSCAGGAVIARQKTCRLASFHDVAELKWNLKARQLPDNKLVTLCRAHLSFSSFSLGGLKTPHTLKSVYLKKINKKKNKRQTKTTQVEIISEPLVLA